MPKPEFCVSKLRIEGFRGIQALELAFDPASPSILIGPNNAGKSTVLQAVSLGLQSGKHARYMLVDEDFFRDASGHSVEEFTIEISLTSIDGGALPAVKGGVGDPIEVHGIRAIGIKGELSCERHLLNSQGDPILLVKSPISKGKQENYKGMGLTKRSYARLGDIARWLPEVWFLDTGHGISLYDWKTGPLRPIVENYKADLLATQWTTQSGRAMPDALHKAHQFLAEQALPTPHWKNELAPKIRAKFAEYLGSSANISLGPSLTPLESWIASALRIDVGPGEGLAPVDARRLGDGWQSLLSLAALELAAEIKGDDHMLLLVEEPETFLHPHLRRRLRRVFARLQNAGHQCIVTTHSPELISFAESQQIVRIRMSSAGCSMGTYATASRDVSLRHEEKLHERGKHEVLFANVAILTEGKGDEFAVRAGFERMGVDLDAFSVSVVDCGNVDNEADYAAICGSLGIPWIAIHDRDMQANGTRKGNTEATHTKLEATRSSRDEIYEWDNDLEEVLGFTGSIKATPERIDQKFGQQTWADLSIDPDLQKYCTTMQATKVRLEAILGSL